MLNTPKSLRGMVTAPHHLASQAGLSVLQDGGSAVEAAVAMAASLAVVYPHMNSIGGDSFWLIAEPDGKIHGISAVGAAAARASLDLYAKAGLKTVPWRGPLAANTVAGTISGWEAAIASVENPMPLDRLLRDAIHHAEAGVVVTAGGSEIARDKDAELRDVFGYADVFRQSGPLKEGAILKQPALARTLRRLAEKGLASFYAGTLADDIARDLEKAGSPVSADDLAAHCATTPTPLSVSIKGAQLYNMAPPTQGIASLLILALFDRFHADYIFLPARFFGRHGKAHPAIAPGTRERDRLAIDFAPFVSQHHLGRPSLAVLSGNNDVDHCGIFFGYCRRSFDAK